MGYIHSERLFRPVGNLRLPWEWISLITLCGHLGIYIAKAKISRIGRIYRGGGEAGRGRGEGIRLAGVGVKG